MAFPSPPSFESDVHPEQLLFLEFPQRTEHWAVEKTLIRWVGGWGVKSTEKNLQ
jgi:hypothetical protein